MNEQTRREAEGNIEFPVNFDSRSETIEDASGWRWLDVRYSKDCDPFSEEARQEMMKRGEYLAKALNEFHAGRWRRVEDGLPSESGRYEVSVIRYADGEPDVDIAMFRAEIPSWSCTLTRSDTVIAYRPTPAPYTEESR